MSFTVIRGNTLKLWHIAILVIAIAEAVALVVLSMNYYVLSKRVPYSFHEKAYVERSIDAFARSRGLPRETVMRGRFPVVARTREGLCVNIRGSAGGIGLVPIYCFDKSGRLVFHEDR